MESSNIHLEALNALPQPVMIFSGTNSSRIELSYFNKTTESMVQGLGLDLQKYPSKLFDICDLQRCLRTVAEGETQMFSVRFKTKDKVREYVADLSHLGGGQILVVFDFRQSTIPEGVSWDDLWRAVVTQPTDYFNLLDKNGTYLYINRYSGGLTPDDLIGKKTIFEFTSEDHQPAVKEALHAVFEKKQVKTWTAYVPFVKSWFKNVATPVIADGEVKAMALFCSDITPHKEAQREIEVLKSQWEAMVESIPHIVYTLNTDFKITYMSKDPGPGYDRSEFIGKSVLDYWPKGRHQELKALFQETMRDGKIRFSTIQLETVPKGVWQQSVSRFENDGQPMFLCVAQDITLEREEQTLLTRMAKMASIGRLAAGVAHEINNPLSVIFGVTEMLQHDRKKEDWSKVDERIHQLASAAGKIQNISQGLRKFARSGNERTLFKPGDIVTEAVQLLSGIPEYRWIEFSWTDESLDLFCRGTPAGYQQAVMNAISNARDAMNGRGRIALSLKRNKNRIVLVIEDTGPGLDEATLARAFDPYFTTKARDKGTGLGLSISKSLIQSMNGFVRLQNLSKGGARLEIDLPAQKPDEENSPADTFAPPDGNTVVIVEDEIDYGNMLKLAFEEEGIGANTFPNYATALKALESGLKVESALLDLNLGDGRGEQLAELILDRCPGAHITFMTGAPGEGEADNTLSIRGRELALLRKPFLLSEAIRQVTAKQSH